MEIFKKFNVIPLLLILTIVCIYSYIFYPGYMSFDSAQQYSQVLSGNWNTISPIIMVIFWSLTNNILEGPGGLFLFYISIYCIGVVIFVFNIKMEMWLKVTLIFIICLWLFNLMILPHLWKDVGLMAFLSLTIGLLQYYQNSHKLMALYGACFVLIIASLFRFESLAYLSILIIYWSYLLVNHFRYRNRTLKIVMISLAVIVFCIISSKAIVKLTKSKEIVMWQTVALWDIAAVSIQVNKVLFPKFTIGPDLQVADLEKAYYPWSNTFLFWKTKKGMNSGLSVPYLKDQYHELFAVWAEMIYHYPLAYLIHRIALVKDLFRIKDSADKNIDMFFSRKMYQYKDKFNINGTKLNQFVTKWIIKYKDVFIFKGWLYFLIELVIIFIFLLKKIKNTFVFVLCFSGILSGIVLIFVAPSAEQRYIVWLINSTLLSLSLLLKSNKSH